MALKEKLLALIPARAGSQRVPGKNIRRLAEHPLIAYSITAAKTSGLFDRIVVSTDSKEIQAIALHYGAEAPFLRPVEYATATSPDIEWIKHALYELGGKYDVIAKLNPTSPFRMPATIMRCWDQFKRLKGCDSIRAVELCHEHPGKMWLVEGDYIRPFIKQDGMDVAWHARQYQDLPKVYIQNSSLEMVWTNVIWETNTREGKVVAPFFTEKHEGFAIDYEVDWVMAEHLLSSGQAELPMVVVPVYSEGAQK